MPNNIEYRELFKLNSVLLTIEDLRALEDILIEDPGTDELKIEVVAGSAVVRETSVDDLLDFKDLPEYTDKVDFGMTRWIDTGAYRGISSGVSLSMHHNFVQCQVHSIDQTWFLGKKLQIIDYYAERKPWYRPLAQLATWYPTIIIVLLFYCGWLLAAKQYVGMIIPLATAVLLLVVTILIVQQRLFPYVRVWLKPKKTRAFGFNEICALIGALGGIGTLVQVFSNFFSET